MRKNMLLLFSYYIRYFTVASKVLQSLQTDSLNIFFLKISAICGVLTAGDYIKTFCPDLHKHLSKMDIGSLGSKFRWKVICSGSNENLPRTYAVQYLCLLL